MKKLLFGVSDTQECRRAIDTIASLFGNRQDLELTLLHVKPDSIVYAESGMVDYSVCAHHEDNPECIIDGFAKELENKGFACKKILKTGNPIDVVLDIANDYDLLIIGASESSLLYRIFGSHQNSFVNASPIPVLVAK